MATHEKREESREQETLPTKPSIVGVAPITWLRSSSIKTDTANVRAFYQRSILALPALKLTIIWPPKKPPARTAERSTTGAPIARQRTVLWPNSGLVAVNP